MNLSSLTNEKLVVLNSILTNKLDIIDALIEKLQEAGKIKSAKEFKEAVLYRESLTATGMDKGLAIPHGKSETVMEASFAVMTLQKPAVDWESVAEGNQVTHVFLLAIPQEDKEGTQMQLLAELMQKMADDNYTRALLASKTPSEFVQKLDSNANKLETTEHEKSIVAITACAAGIAHTYMAADALIAAGEKLGVSVYVEKQGANGIENKLTNAQLKDASAAIIAVDVAIKGEDRFSHLPVIRTRVAEPIRDAESLIKKALAKAESSERGTFKEQEESGRKDLWILSRKQY